jgi:hypothetical protein
MFLERRLYRRRRMMDAARLLPLVGLLLFLAPLLWAPNTGEGSSTAYGMVYLFAIWALLIAISAMLSRWLADPRSEGPDPQPQNKAER